MSRPLEIVTLRAGLLQARFVPSIGMVGVSLRHRGVELLGQRRGLEAYVERGSTFGIPLLHPWANRLGGFTYRAAGRDAVLEAGMTGLRTEEHGLPMHGLLAAHPGWRVTSRGDAALRAELDLTGGGDGIAGFPFPHVLAIEATLDPAALTVVTTVVPTGDVPVPIAFGFHPYLAIHGDRAAALVEIPARARVVLDDRGLPTGARAPFAPVAGPLWDTVYDDLLTDLTGEPLRLHADGRSVAVRLGEGYPYAQVFAPAGQSVIAFEPMTAPTDALRTGDGLRLVTEPFEAVFSIEVERPDQGSAAS